MKGKLLILLLCAFTAMLLSFAGAEILVVPKAITQIEEEAFSSIGPVDSVFIPETVISIAPDAFSDADIAIYGIPGSQAEAFARETGRTFVSAAIEIANVFCPEWVPADAKIHVSSSATSSIGAILYRYSLTDGTNTYILGDFSSDSACEGVIPVGGVYDLIIEAKTEYHKALYVKENAVTVAPHVLFSGSSITLGTERVKNALSEEETREVVLSSSDEGIFTVNGTSITGVRPGSAYLVARAIHPEGTVESRITVNVYQSVSSVAFSDAPNELFIGAAIQISAAFSPDSARSEEFVWLSDDPEIASITQDGEITAHRQGAVNIIARIDGKDFVHPLRVTLPVESVQAFIRNDETLYTKGKVQIETAILPKAADNKLLRFQSMNTAVARVDANGVITGISEGTTQILLTAKDGAGASCTLDITVIRGVDTVTISANKTHVYPGDTIEIESSVLPESAYGKKITWISSNSSIASISSDGLFTARNPGFVTITARAENGVSASLTFRVLAFETPIGLILSESAVYLNPGDQYALSYSVYPEGASAEVVWQTQNAAIAKVSENGVITAVSPGVTSVGVVSTEDPCVYATCKITVLNAKKTLVMPKRKTVISEIGENLRRINDVKASAFNELDTLYLNGKITKSVRDSRKEVIANAFEMYSFPWMTLSHQVYWKEENSEGGVKDFQPGIVYYGLPYISGSYYNQRLYNAEKAVTENRYYLSDSGQYYILNQDNLYKGKYCGNDCSSMTAISYFGFISGIGSWNTNLFETTTKFKNLSDPGELYPGDIIVRGYKHVVIFLYYANPEKTQIVVIEQGGSEYGINTVSTGMYDIDYYIKNGYKARRYSAWY